MHFILNLHCISSPQLWTVSRQRISSPPLSQTGAPVALSQPRRHTNKWSSASPFLPSLNPHLATSHRTLSNVFPFITGAIGYTNTNIYISGCDYPTTRLAQYVATQSGAIRVPHCEEQICHRHRRWIGLRPIQTSLTAAVAPVRVNFTASRKNPSWMGQRKG